MIKKTMKNEVLKGSTCGKLLKFSFEWWTLIKSFFFKDTLKSVHIQFTNNCNLNCKWCSLKKGCELMEEKFLIKILEELKKFNVKEINLWNGGEPLLHPNLINLLRIIKRYKNYKVNFLTNGILLNKQLSKKIIKLNVLDTLGFSVDGGSKQGYEELRRGGKWDILKKYVFNFIKLNKNIETYIICVISPEKPLNIKWMKPEFKHLLNSVDYYRLTYPEFMPGGPKPLGCVNNNFIKTNKRICLALLQGLVILQNGKVLPCCIDLNGICVLGNLNEQSLKSIVNRGKRRQMIKMFLKGEKDKIPLCKDCNRFNIKTLIKRKDE